MFSVGDIVIGNRKNNYNLTGRGIQVRVVRIKSRNEIDVELKGKVFTDVEADKFDKYTEVVKKETPTLIEYDKDTTLIQVYTKTNMIDVRNLKTNQLIESVESLVVGNLEPVSQTKDILTFRGIPQEKLTKEFTRMLTHPVMELSVPKASSSVFIPYSRMTPSKSGLILLEGDGYYSFDYNFGLGGVSVASIKNVLGYTP